MVEAYACLFFILLRSSKMHVKFMWSPAYAIKKVNMIILLCIKNKIT